MKTPIHLTIILLISFVALLTNCLETSYGKTPIPQGEWSEIKGHDCPFSQCQDVAATLCSLPNSVMGNLCSGFNCPEYIDEFVGNEHIQGCPAYFPRERCQNYTSFYRTCLFNLSYYCIRPSAPNSCGARRYTWCEEDMIAHVCGPCVDTVRTPQCITGCTGSGKML
jgi:hypothetical protein